MILLLLTILLILLCPFGLVCDVRYSRVGTANVTALPYKMTASTSGCVQQCWQLLQPIPAWSERNHLPRLWF